MSDIQILVCTSEYPPDYSSGIGNVAYNVVEQLKKMGVDCTVCSPTGPDIELRSLKGYGLLGLIPYWHKVNKYLKKRADDYDLVWFLQPLIIGTNPFQKCLISIFNTTYGLNKRTRHSKFPLKLRIYYKIAAKIEKYCLNKIDNERTTFFVDSPIVSDELEVIGIDKKKIVCIPNGVDTNRFAPSHNKEKLRAKFGIPKDHLVILSVGRLTVLKRPYTLVKTFSLIEKCMENVTLVIVGTGELAEDTKKLIRELKIKNIKLLGFIDPIDLPDVFACSDVYIMASLSEGQPLSLIEALSSGLPPIVSNIPTLTEFVEESKAGIVVDFNDTKMAANNIIEYLKDEQLIQKQSAQVRRFITNGWDWKDISKRYLEEFQKLMHYQNQGEIP